MAAPSPAAPYRAGRRRLCTPAHLPVERTHVRSAVPSDGQACDASQLMSRDPAVFSNRSAGTPATTGESVEDQYAAGTLSRAQRVECVVQIFQPDAAGDELVEQQIPGQIVADQRGHVALHVGRPEIAAPDDLLVDEAPGAERHGGLMRLEPDDDGLAAHVERRPCLLDRLL